MAYKLHGYQRRGVDRFRSQGSLALFWDMGLGKTLTCLHAIAAWPWRQRTLIVAPLRCCTRVWPTEIVRHGLDLTCSVIVGPEKQRLAAVQDDADIHVINPENLVWLYKYCKERKSVPYDNLIVDESTGFKSPGSKRFKALKQIVPHVQNRIILTGTPIPQNYHDLWAQIWILDQGESLGATATEFRSRYCEQDYWKKWQVRTDCYQKIDAAIAHLVDRGDARDLLDMPDLIFNQVEIELPPAVMAAYRAGVAEIQTAAQEPEFGFDSTADNFMTLRTLCSGFAYLKDDATGERVGTKWLHRGKLDAIEEIHEGIGGKPLLVAFNFTAEREALVDRFDCPFIDGSTKPKESDRLIDKWSAGALPMLAIHPKAVGYGINLQSGGHHLAWFSLPTSLSDWAQTNARLYRQGQKSAVTVHTVVASGTVDVRINKLLTDKDMTQSQFLASMKGYFAEGAA